MIPDDQKIVLLAVRTGSEQGVVDQVRARLMRTYLPKYLVNLRHGGMVARSLFPGYVFAWAMESAWPTLRTLVGVRDFVRGGPQHQVQIIPHALVDELRAREGPTGYVRIESDFVVGQRVSIKDKREWSGIYLGLSNRHKARVLFAMLGADVELELFQTELTAA